MSQIFKGMLFVFLDFHLDFNAIRIGLIPDFIGYYFMLKGLTELAGFSDRFSKIRPYVNGMLVYAVCSYILDLLGVSSSLNGLFGVILGLIATITSLYISYTIIQGIQDIEILQERDLNTSQLYSTWKILAISTVLTYLLLIIPALALICILIGFVCGVYYLYIFSKTKRLFYENTSEV